MTVAVLRGVGVAVDDSVPNHWVVAPGPIRAFDQRIEQDLSNAGPFLAAALASGGTVRIPDWPAGTTQVGDLWRSILADMGAHGQPGRRRPDGHRRARDQGRGLCRNQRARPHRRGALRPGQRPLPADRHRPPARPRDGPAGRAGHRDQPARRRRRGNQRRAGDPPGQAARRRRPQLRGPPDGHRRGHPRPGRGGHRGRGHRHHRQDHAGVPADVGGHARPGPRVRRRRRKVPAVARSTDSWDESDVRIRPNKKGSRPRTKDRPSHDDAVIGPHHHRGPRPVHRDRRRGLGRRAHHHRRPGPRTAPQPRGGRRLRLPRRGRLRRTRHPGPAGADPGPPDPAAPQRRRHRPGGARGGRQRRPAGGGGGRRQSGAAHRLHRPRPGGGVRRRHRAAAARHQGGRQGPRGAVVQLRAPGLPGHHQPHGGLRGLRHRRPLRRRPLRPPGR